VGVSLGRIQNTSWKQCAYIHQANEWYSEERGQNISQGKKLRYDLQWIWENP